MVLIDLSGDIQFEFLKLNNINDGMVTYNNVVNHDEASNYETLAYFNAVDTSVNVDGVGAEDGQGSHVNFVNNS